MSDEGAKPQLPGLISDEIGCAAYPSIHFPAGEDDRPSQKSNRAGRKVCDSVNI